MVTRFQRLTAFIVAVVLAMPLSLFAEKSTVRRTDLEQLAADLERVLGKGSVEVRGTERRPSTPSAVPVAGSVDEQVVEAMNVERRARGLQPLRLNRQLSLAADDRIRDMFSQRYFDHVAPDGTQPFVWVTRRGYRYGTVGENLAVGYRSADRVVNGWMNSPGHRANLLGRKFDEVGISVASGSPTNGYRGPTVVALYASK